MASYTIKLNGRIRHIDAGVIAITKSAGVTNLLQQAANTCAARCNAMASSTIRAGQPNYNAYTKQLTYTAAGVVSTGNLAARIDNAYHNTLKKGCNV